MRHAKGFTLVELLVVIAIIAVLLAILLPSLASVKNLAQRVRCGYRVKEIASAYNLYQESNGGNLPTPEQNNANTGRWIQHNYMYRRETLEWYNMGCLFAAGFIDDGRLFYCPATEGWLDDYKEYCDPAPWGTLPQASNTAKNRNQWVRAYKGYAYWPQSKDIVKTNVAAEVHANAVGLYQVGYPKTPVHISKLLQNKAFAADYTFHAVKGSGWNLNAAFPDGHVAFQAQPKDPATGQSTYFATGQYSKSIVEGDVWFDTAEQNRSVKVTIAEFMFVLQP
jgi:prepilin-type N-terminal cleavage/methylation domain-containing protein/prepilin-type processing-associated H-X9-DG protein